MNWKDEFKSKVATPEEAIACIKDGQWIASGHAAGAVREIMHALAQNREKYHNVHIFHMTTLGDNECYHPEGYGHFHHVSNFLSGNSREAIASGNGDFFPAYFKDVPSMLTEGVIPCDVAIFQATPPDADGNMSLGISCDYAPAAISKASKVIIEVNDRMPRIGGQNFINVADVDYLVPVSYQLPEIPHANPSDVELAIGRYCSSLVEDGATLQLGIGAIPNAVLLSLDDKNDLGIHSEMFSDGVVSLMRKGIINGSRKTLHKGKVIATFVMGTQELYDFCDGNSDIELYPVNYTNDPRVIAQNDKLISINSCLEVDLQGQVVSEMIGPKQYSGIGGQIDFILGAAMSKGGKSIIAMPSTAAHGKISRIKPFSTPGAAISTTRNDVNYVVTEYGIAHLKGRTLRQRAIELIRIAHPDFRPELIEEFERRFQCKYEG